MKENIQEIKPTEGLGDLRFGLTREEVRQMLGEPTEIDVYSLSGEEGDHSESWHYDELELSMSFDEDDDYRLITIAVSSDKYKLDGRALVNLQREELIDLLKERGITDFEEEDAEELEMPGHQLISTEELFINFWLENDRVKEIQWSPLMDDEDEVRWPD